ncbi:hypothetical protein POSPLADRAFT_1072487 [Postia placenta MAD-698-R-SB12]|uniref:Uncharacterized protein n=1 Tax=Postia placenta MAD-698-R-SB12 TaxID=670580 RepID=A0A1X6NGC3_9APHY|nr:hypothetical protein POSPLADRAFT_1072487 [Postia placenta MAD-698-R-SB12]OSX67679.1 hypothetical protein POSPLADRAFT_1072487 [Postia placenta MAD-698-R-SB12]
MASSSSIIPPSALSYASPTLVPASTWAPITITSAQVVPLVTQAVASAAADVVIRLQADVSISHYRDYYDGPVESFQPKYYALDDGTLLSDRYVRGQRLARVWLCIAGALCIFFLRNTWLALSYIRRSRVKDKTLFYLLLLSQVLGLLAAITTTVGDLDMSANCNTVGAAKKVFSKFSCDTMITGILGMKAYRCLSNSRIILAFLISVAAVMVVLLGLELSTFEGSRTIYGNCAHIENTRMLFAIIITVYVETAILCGCFLLAIWRTYRTQNVARVTIRTPEENNTRTWEILTKEDDGLNSRRGWWDYVPEVQSYPAEHTTLPGIIKRLAEAFLAWGASHPSTSPPACSDDEWQVPFPTVQDQSAKAPWGVSLSPYVAFTRFIAKLDYALFPSGVAQDVEKRGRATLHSLIKGLIGSQILLGVEGWIILDWIFVTLFTMHSFERVVHRHELEAVLQHPAAWDRILHSETDHAKVFFEKRSRRSKSPKVRTGSALRPRHREEPSDDFDASMHTAFDPSADTSMSPFTIAPRLSAHSPYKGSPSSSLPSFHVHSPSPFGSRPYSWDSAVSLPPPSIREEAIPPDQMRPSTAPADARTRCDERAFTFGEPLHVRTYDIEPAHHLDSTHSSPSSSS